MANIFKQNMRFESLNESGSASHDKRSTERRTYNNEYNDGRKQNNAQSFKTRADVAAKEQEAKLERTDENFPSLVATTRSTNKNSQSYGNFSQCVKTVIQTEIVGPPPIDPDLIDLKPGWILLKHDSKTHTTIMKSKEFPTLEPIEKTADDLAWEVLDEWVSLHAKRTNEYIDNWGYEEWERLFRFPNYDYEYFDKLDALYEEEQEKERVKKYEAMELAAENNEYDY